MCFRRPPHTADDCYQMKQLGSPSFPDVQAASLYSRTTSRTELIMNQMKLYFCLMLMSVFSQCSPCPAQCANGMCQRQGLGLFRSQPSHMVVIDQQSVAPSCGAAEYVTEQPAAPSCGASAYTESPSCGAAAYAAQACDCYNCNCQSAPAQSSASREVVRRRSRSGGGFLSRIFGRCRS